MQNPANGFPARPLGPLIPTTLSYINANFIEHYFEVTVVSLTNDATKHEFDDGDDSERSSYHLCCHTRNPLDLAETAAISIAEALD